MPSSPPTNQGQPSLRQVTREGSRRAILSGTMQTPALDWHRSSLCQTGECVEISDHDNTVLMRNSARPESGYIFFTREEFGSFVKAVKAGQFDLAGGLSGR